MQAHSNAKVCWAIEDHMCWFAEMHLCIHLLSRPPFALEAEPYLRFHAIWCVRIIERSRFLGHHILVVFAAELQNWLGTEGSFAHSSFWGLEAPLRLWPNSSPNTDAFCLPDGVWKGCHSALWPGCGTVKNNSRKVDWTFFSLKSVFVPNKAIFRMDTSNLLWQTHLRFCLPFMLPRFHVHWGLMVPFLWAWVQQTAGEI